MKKLLSTICIALFTTYAFAINPVRIDSINQIKNRINRMQQLQSLLNKPDRLVTETFSDKEENFNPKTRPEAKTNNSRIFKISQANNKAIIKCDSMVSISSSGTPIEKDEFAYNSNGNETLWIYYIWDDTSSKWVKKNKDEFAYNSNGNRTLRIDYDWDNKSSEWVENFKIEYTYDSNGNECLVGIWYDWDNTSSKWVEKVKSDSRYDSNGNETLIIEYDWNNTSSEWVEKFKIEYTYDSNGNEILYISYTWDNTSSKWIGSYKYELTYDANNNETLFIKYTWDDASSKWVENHKEEYTYDSYGNITLYIEYFWDNTSSKWVESYKCEYNFDYKYTLQELCQISFSDWFFYQFNINIPIEGKYYDWDSDSNNWKSDYEIETCYYSPLSNTRNSDVQDTKLSIYPNPAKNYIHIDGLDSSESVKIYNLQGSEVLQAIINSNDAISVSNLPKGVYILQITNQEGTYNTKFVKE